MKAIDCAWVEEGDLVARYVGGRLGDTETERFEAHCLSCERCWAEVRAAVEIRDAAGVAFVAPPALARPRPARDVWTLLAAAAAVLVAVVGLSQLSHRAEDSGPAAVWRGAGSEVLSLTAAPDAPGALVLRWPPRDGAETYLVEIAASDGTTVLERETSAARLRILASDLPPIPPEAKLYATVQALDATRQTVARSERKRLPEF